jgi:hypothetical protein|tara:strand:- start:103 stop:294 length:192 start_codon:yes stop_codon:yes gene_type:complete
MSRQRGYRQGVSPSDYLIERFEKFLTNDWVHMEKKVSALDAKVQLIIGMLTIMIGLMVYAVVK